MVAPLVSVTIVTFDSERVLPACLESLAAQRYRPLEVVLVDNNSSDHSIAVLEQYEEKEICGCRPQIILNAANRGFAAAQNQAIHASRGEWVLCLNPDVILQPDFIEKLVAAAARDEKVGAACGKLLRWQIGGNPEKTTILDSTGMYFLPNLRHLDRGAEEEDRGQYEREEYVFGASGAAALFRRAMIDDVSVVSPVTAQPEFFDEDFFAYREDADLAWRALLMGWRCLYGPAAVGWHERRVTPERREQLPHEINWHSVKNRFLMRMKNIGFGLWWRTLLPATFRDLMIFGYAALRNWRLFSALAFPLTHWRTTMAKRKLIQAKRKVSDRELARWFNFDDLSPRRS